MPLSPGRNLELRVRERAGPGYKVCLYGKAIPQQLKSGWWLKVSSEISGGSDLIEHTEFPSHSDYTILDIFLNTSENLVTKTDLHLRKILA